MKNFWKAVKPNDFTCGLFFGSTILIIILSHNGVILPFSGSLLHLSILIAFYIVDIARNIESL